MDVQQQWKMRFSFRNATVVICFLNFVAAFFLLQVFFGFSLRRSPSESHLDPAQLKYILESEELRRAMEPLDLIRRIKEIQQEANSEPGIETNQAPKQTAAVDLSKRLKDMRAMNDANSQKVLEEWRKRKMERARQRELEKNGTISQL
ncbi:uncharacterized protein [Typha angustifolia]|uniref:uncharacterized protein n=1 Tax=Typha angustifolia TaxID=59011 RepID=UPI003C3099EF